MKLILEQGRYSLNNNQEWIEYFQNNQSKKNIQKNLILIII